MNQWVKNKRLCQRRISVSKKLMLSQRVKLKHNGVYTWGTISDWIKNEPQLMYMHVYNYKANSLVPVQLTRDAINLLKEALKTSYPELYNSIEFKKNFRKGLHSQNGF
jgi:hypothetical protein